MLQSMQPFYPLFFMHLNSYLTLFLCRVNNKEEEEEEKEISTRSIEESMSVSRRGSSSFDVSGIVTEKEIEYDTINMDGHIIHEDFVLEEAMVKAKTPSQIKARGNYTSLARGQTYLTLIEIIMSVVVASKRKRVSTPVDTSVLTSFVEALLVMMIFLSLPLTLAKEAITIGTSAQGIHVEAE